MYAIIEDSGTQIRVKAGDVLDVDLRRLAPEAGTVTFERVLLLGEPGQGEPVIGTPYVDGAAVTAEVIGTVRGEKIDIFKYKRRKGYRRRRGHRQSYLRIKIGEITGPVGERKPKRTTKKSKEE